MSETEEAEKEKTEKSKGAFLNTLHRNNKQIRQDRATIIGDNARMTYRREVEDLIMEIKQMKMEREGLLDLSPTDAKSLVMASDFDAKEFTRRDIELGIKIRNAEIKLGVASDRYFYLFGEKLNMEGLM